jgi:hypothetical protein
MTQPTVPTDLGAQQLRDAELRDRAHGARRALYGYEWYMQRALEADLRHGDERSARSFRADAKAALHAYPDLLVMVEGKP